MIESGRTDARKAVPIIARQAAELDRLIGELVDTVRISSDRLNLERSWFDLRELVREAVQDYEMLAPGRLSLEVPAPPVRGYWDRVRLGQAVRNLLSNAIKYSPDSGEVRVRLLVSGGTTQLSVSDDGLGIEPELLTRIFDRFYRAHDAEEQAVSGLGLGLFITQAIIESHGGRIWATSDGQGRGSTFSAVLPLDGSTS
jgi:signal transduction histidine kinase